VLKTSGESFKNEMTKYEQESPEKFAHDVAHSH
jgi:molybdopterin-containing oxidoreductase family membrane subunit